MNLGGGRERDKKHERIRYATVAVLYVATYVILDRLTFLHPFSDIGITPWDPPQGVTMAFILRFGLHYAPIVLIAMGIAEYLVRYLAAPWLPMLPSMISVVVTAGGYIGASIVLLKVFRLDPNLWRIRDVLRFLLISASAAALVAYAVVDNFVGFGLISDEDFWSATLRSWLGDFVGILTLAPVLLVATRPTPILGPDTPNYRTLLPVLEVMAQVISIASTMWFIFRFDFSLEIKLFYLTFVPIIWVAMRHGLAGAAMAILLTEITLKIAFYVRGYGAPAVIDFQLLMLTLGLTGLLVGGFVSERRQVGRLLSENESRLRAILHTAPDAIVTLDQCGVIGSANPAALQVFGWREPDLIGMPIQGILPDLPLIPSPPRRTVGLRRGGIDFPAEAAIGSVAGTLGQHHIIITRDITERVEAETLAHHHQIELAHADRVTLVGEMACAIAHEESQPLAAIAAYARACRLLLQTPNPDLTKIGSAVDKLAAQTIRAGTILNRLRDFLHRGEIELVPNSINNILNEALAIVRPDVAHRNITIDVDLEQNLPPVLADRIHIQQVILNLVRNAADALADSEATVKNITISVKRQQNDILVAVRDTGPGIDHEMANRLFTPFTTTKQNGMGLGLSISRTIIAAHGGQLCYVPGNEPGATFHFDLRIAHV